MSVCAENVQSGIGHKKTLNRPDAFAPDFSKTFLESKNEDSNKKQYMEKNSLSYYMSGLDRA